jgi:heptosyltransferase-3
VGVPLVALFGPTQPLEFGPWPREHGPTQPWQARAQRQQVGNIVLLQGPDLPGRTCVPCGRMGCEDRHDSPSHCLAALAPQRVLAELRQLLRRAPRFGDGPTLAVGSPAAAPSGVEPPSQSTR